MGDLTGLAAVVLIFGSIPAIMIVWLNNRARERDRLRTQELIRLAIDKGQPLPAEVIATITRSESRPPARQRDLRVGIVWIAVALGMVAFAYALGNSEGADAFWPVIGLSAFPGFIGVALVVMGLLNRHLDPR